MSKASYKVISIDNGKRWMVEYHAAGFIDQDVRGTHGLGVKIFDTKAKAEGSGKRYVKKMKELGYEVD